MDKKRRFKGMLARIFSDATATAEERDELKAFFASPDLTQAEIKEVLADFVATTWKITMADGVVSDVEKRRLREIVDAVAIDREVLPDAWRAIVDDQSGS